MIPIPLQDNYRINHKRIIPCLLRVLFPVLAVTPAVGFGAGSSTPQGGWRDAAQRVTLRSEGLEATFQGGQLVALRLQEADTALLHAIRHEPIIALFGNRSLNLDTAEVSQQIAGKTLACRYTWPDGSSWDLAWKLEADGDLILRTSAKVSKPVDRMIIAFPACDLSQHALTVVSNFGVGVQMKGPWNGKFGADGTDAFRPGYVQPIVALFEGEGSGWFLEGREDGVGPANVLAFGHGQTVEVALVRGFPMPTVTPQMFEIRLRAYRGAWQDAVDPYVDWLERGLGMLPLDRKPQSWVRDIRAQSAIDVDDLAELDALARQVEPTQTLVGKITKYRKYPFDVNWPNYELSAGADKWIRRARELGFHVAAHFNTTGIDHAYPELIRRFCPGLQVTGKDETGSETYSGWNSPGGTHVYCSTAYKPWRDYLIEQMRPIVEAGVDVIYLDESHSPTGAFEVRGMTAIQGVMALEQEILRAFPNVVLYVEQINPMNARYASFALNSQSMGHPLGGYLFQRFVKFTGFDRMHAPLDEPTMDVVQSWGFQIPAVTSDRSWMDIARAFQRFRLDPDLRLTRNSQRLSGYVGPNGVTAYYENRAHQRGLVVYEPGRPEQWFGVRVTGVRSWPGPGALQDWPVYAGTTLLGLNPMQTYVFEETVELPADRFHLNRVPTDFHLHNHIVGHNGSYLKLVFSGHGEIGMVVPDNQCRVFLDDRELPVDRTKRTGEVRIDAAPDRSVTLLAFFQAETELVGRWDNLPWQSGSRPPREGWGYLRPNQADGFFNHVGGTGVLIGRLPETRKLRLRGEYGMVDVSKSAGDGVVRINGREVMRVPAGARPFRMHRFETDISAFRGQHVLLEFSCEGPIAGFAGANWLGPAIIAEE